MEERKIVAGDFVVPLFEKEKKVLKVVTADKCIVAEIEDGFTIAAPCNFRLATAEEIVATTEDKA